MTQGNAVDRAQTARLAMVSAAAASERSAWVPGPLRALARRVAGRTATKWRVRSPWRALWILRRSGLFDATAYAATLQGWRGDPLKHYVMHGFAEDRPPNRLFDSLWYLAHNPDVLEAGVNPLLHYIRTGEREGRRPHPLFDPRWYAEANSDVDPRRGLLRHYLAAGRRELRQPSPAFNPAAYLRANPDLERLGIDPVSHWLAHGRDEGRLTAPISEPSSSPAARFRLAFGPGPDGRPVYRLEPGEPAYTYVPPIRPDDLEARVRALGAVPRFSIVTPVYNVAPDLLQAAIDSVISQWWPHWELILVDDASSDPSTRDFLRNLSHPQIIIAFEGTNRGIAGATNAALARARGDYVVFLDNDDVLTPDCLFALAERIAATDADYLYSDEDKLSAEGAYVEPFFKPDWSPDAMMSTMYTCHVSCARRSLVEAVGGLRSEFDGAQDYDLVLRITERANRIEHIPKVLYHWRILPTSVAGGMAAKPHALDAVRRLKHDALARRGLEAEVEEVPAIPGQFRVNYRPRRQELVSIVIPSRDNVDVLRSCIDSIRALTAYERYEIVIVDNGSQDPQTLEYVRGLGERTEATVLSDPRPFNFSALCNSGAEAARGDVLLFLNDDTEVLQTDWIERMLGFAQLDHVGAVGAKLLYPNGRIQHCGVITLPAGPSHAFGGADAEQPDYFGRHLLEYDWTAVTAACLMLERAKFEKISGFDEAFPVAYNDVDLCLRLRAEHLFNVTCQAVRLVHYESVSRGADVASDPVRMRRLRADWRRLYAKHPQALGSDPFHSPNLSPSDVSFGFAFV